MTFYTVLKSRFMTLTVSWLLLLFMAMPVAESSELIIQDATLISPERSQALSHASVRIKEGEIVEIKSGRFTNTEQAKILDGRDHYLIPGLMDSHLHTTIVPGLGFMNYGHSKAQPELVRLYEQQLPRSLLYFGVTQILDPAALPARLERLLAHEQRPDIFHCGAAPILNGYPFMLLGSKPLLKDFPYFIIEPGSHTEQLPNTIDLSQHTPTAVVQRMHQDGAMCVKLFFEDGFGFANHWPILSLDSIRQIRQTAHRLGMKVLAHANALDMQQLALEAEIDVLAHGLWNWNQFNKASDLPTEIQQHLDQIRQHNIAYQPTLRVGDGIHALFSPATLQNPVLSKIVPKPLLDWYHTQAAQWFKQELIIEEGVEGLPDSRIAQMLKNSMISRSERTLRYLAEKNYPLLLASDFPANPGYGNQPGLSTYQELVHMAKIGVSLKAILAAATINNAQTFGLEAQYGSIEVGKIANLLLLKANPWQEVSAYEQIEQVILHGQVIERDSLAAD